MKLDLGCGKNKRAGEDWTGVDVIAFPGVDVVLDLGNVNTSWPWENDSIEEVHCSHFLEHLEGPQRIHFVNELYRVLKTGAKAQIIVPHWCSSRAYGDLTHKWPPVVEMWFFYLKTEWRDQNAPHNDFYKCNFDVTWGYGLRNDLLARNQEYQNYALANYKEAATDIIATLTKA